MNQGNDQRHESPARKRAGALAGERGQGLVEYALIIALVSLAAIAALGFLSDEINDLFRKSGNVLNTVEASSGGGSVPPGFTPPANGTAAVGDPAAIWYSSGLTGFDGAGAPPVPGVFSTSSTGHGAGSGATYSFPSPSTGSFSCTWSAVPNPGYYSTTVAGPQYDNYCT